jgi:Protein of unknown function (DUF2845)
MSSGLVAVVVLTAVVLGAEGIGQAMECNGRVVSMGASPWDGQGICGDPVQVNDTVELVLKPVYTPRDSVEGHLPGGVPKQVWTYHFGSSQLLYSLTFLDGTLVKIGTGGHRH